MNDELIVVTGAAGQTGQSVLRHLTSRGARTRALVSRESSVAAVRAAGAVEVTQGRLERAEDMRAALRGSTRVYHICPAMSDAEIPIGGNLISAALAEGVRHLVFHSVVHAQADALPHHRDKRVVEGMFIESPLPYTILQPAMYMQNTRWEWRNIVERGVYALPYSEHARMSLVDLEDVSEAAAIVLTGDTFVGGCFELCSGDNLTRVQMAEVLAQALGREVHAETGLVEDWKRAACASGTRRDFQIDRVAVMFEHYHRHGLSGGNRKILEMMLGRAPNDYAAFVRRFAVEQGHTLGTAGTRRTV